MLPEIFDGAEKTCSRTTDEAARTETGAKEIDAGGVRVVSALALLGKRRLVQIEHRGERYTLRLTKNDRLILTK